MKGGPRHQTTTTIVKMFRGRLRLERRNEGRTIYARTFLHGRLIVKSTGQSALRSARPAAASWYRHLLEEERRRVGN